MSRCPSCSAEYSPHGGGHCRGAPFSGCCATFSNDATAEAHRVGPFNPPGERRCLSVQEMLERGWRLTPRGWTHYPPMTPEQLARKTGRPVEGPVQPSVAVLKRVFARFR